MDYAVIKNGVVTNIIVLNDENADEFPGTVKLGDTVAFIGDQYADGMFTRPEEAVPEPE